MAGAKGKRDQHTETPLYAGKRSRADLRKLELARDMEGLTEEIAALRVYLADLLANTEADSRLVADAAGVLVRAVATQYRLSPKARNDLAANMAGLLNSIGDQLKLPDA